MRFRLLHILAAASLLIIFAVPGEASAQDTLVSAIGRQYRITPVLPFPVFDHTAPNAPIPGATIAGVTQRSFDGISVFDISTATICAPDGYPYGKLRGTQGFRRKFSADKAPNKNELRIFLDLDDATLDRIRSYEVTVTARYLTIPYDRLLDAKSLARCTAPPPAAARTVIKPIIADLNFILETNEPLSELTASALLRRFNGNRLPDRPLAYYLTLPSRLVGLNISE